MTAPAPADSAYPISTEAPTSTNRTTSAPTHSLLNFPDRRTAVSLRYLESAIPMNITAISAENVIGVLRAFSADTRINDILSTIITLIVSRT